MLRGLRARPITTPVTRPRPILLGPMSSKGRGASLSAQLHQAVSASLKANIAIPRSKSWVHEFIVETVAMSLEEEGVPPDVDAALGLWEQLLHDHVDDLDAADVRDFCAMLLRRCGELLEGEEEEGEEGEAGGCAMCGREMPRTFHHLVPKDVHSNYKKKGYTADQLNAGIMVCRPCHSAIHRTYTNKLLASDYNTLEALMQSEELQRFISWARKQRVTGNDIDPNLRRYPR